MERTILLTAILGTAFIANAQLAPQQQAPLREHLIEVNAEWNTYAADLPNADRMVSFINDTERIAQHLHLVREHLAAVPPEGLSAVQARHRAHLLQNLDRYADNGRFPQNHVLPFRNPIFIDPHNTACAVGQLIIESGDRSLAERISAEMNQSYIRDMHWPEIGAWANTNGFTGDELAWIQPTYGPMYPWTTLGGGTDGQVSELLRSANGDLIVAGGFTQAGGAAHQHVARWNGTAYEAMGSLPDGTINCSIEFDGNVYIGGAFNGGTVDLLQWNGTIWLPSTVFASKYAEVTALHIHDGTLHAAGGRSGFAGIDYLVQRLGESGWSSVGQVLNGPISTLETFDGTLVCGGSFTDNFLSNDNTILHVARLNINTWEQWGDGLNGNVYDMLVYQQQLYAAGDLVSEIETSFGLARIALEALAWEQLMPNIGNYFTSPLDGMTHVEALVERNGVIFLGGELHYGADIVGTHGDGVVRFGGNADEFEPYIQFGGPVYDLELTGTHTLVVGGVSGEFTGYLNITSVDLTTGIGERPERLTLTVSPNPTTDLVTVQVPSSLSGSATFRVIDATGRLVESPAQRNGDLVRFSTQGLASGTYQIEVSNGNVTATGRFVKE